MTDRSKYSKLTKAKLIEMCDEKKLKYTSKTLKSELVDILLGEFDDQEQPSKNVAKKSSAPVAKKVVAKKVAPKKEAVLKPSVIVYIHLIRQAIDNLNSSLNKKDKEEAEIYSKTLRAMLDSYDFSCAESLKVEIERAINDVNLTFQVVKKEVKRFVPGTYKSVKLDTGIKFGSKTEEVSKFVKKPVRISITLEELRKELENPDFIKNFSQSVRDLMIAKSGVYSKKKIEIEREYEALSKKVKILKSTGTDDRAIRDMYPGFDGLKVFIIDLGDLADLTRAKSRNIVENEIKENLREAIDDPEFGLSSIVGRKDIKNKLASQIYSFSKGYKTFLGSFNNMVITGDAGVGKSHTAQIIAFVFSKIGVLAKNVIKIVSRTDLIGQYIGQTGPRTRSALIETLEGVLFIDEAYQLTESPEVRAQGSKDFGGEAVTEIVNFLDKFIGLNIVIVAGYENLMTKNFMSFNEGLPRRFPFRYALAPYSNSELADILLTNLRRRVPDSIDINDDVANFLFSFIEKIQEELPFAFKNQAGDMLNLATSLNKAICGSFKIKWDSKSLKNNIQILMSGIDDFLDPKGVNVYESSIISTSK